METKLPNAFKAHNDMKVGMIEFAQHFGVKFHANPTIQDRVTTTHDKFTEVVEAWDCCESNVLTAFSLRAAVNLFINHSNSPDIHTLCTQWKSMISDSKVHPMPAAPVSRVDDLMGPANSPPASGGRGRGTSKRGGGAATAGRGTTSTRSEAMQRAPRSSTLRRAPAVSQTTRSDNP